MVTSADDILAMLDQVEENMLRCPVCGRSNDLFYVYVEGYSRCALSSLTGALYVEGDSECVDVPREVTPQPRWLSCGNVTLHPDNAWHWWLMPDDVPIFHDESHLGWEDFMKARADAP